MWAQLAFNGDGTIALLFPKYPDRRPTRMSATFQQLGLALVGVLLLATADLPCTAADNRGLTVSVARRDLRPLGLVTVQLSGAVNLQGVTDANGRVAFPGLPPAGAITVTPSRSG